MIITSLLDTDLYKLTMQQAVLEHYPNSKVSYRFTNRGGTKFSRRCFESVLSSVALLSKLSITQEECQWLTKQCPYFTPSYLAYLNTFKFKPKEQVKIDYVVEEVDENGIEWGRFDIEIKGNWAETILYEVPLMAILSETYFAIDDQNWDYQGQLASAKAKGKELIEAGCILSEFGTRRRRSLLNHDLVIQGLMEANKEFSGNNKLGGKLAGTSNVHLAQKYNLLPIGTIAHEWIMAVAAVEGYEGSNGKAMDLWDITYPTGVLSIALTDTFSTKPFFDDFISNPVRARHWKGLRQDSGDPITFLKLAKEAFIKVGADPKSKVIVFSDGLNSARCLELKKASDEAGVGCSFGVGTFFTNDFQKVTCPSRMAPGEGEIREGGETSKALNMVIKLYQIDNQFCVKISDEMSKNTGNPDAVREVKETFGLPQEVLVNA